MSRFEFKLPDIGEGVTEGEIVSWLVSAGQAVAQDQEMVEVMTDKATVTIGAPKPGKVVEIMGKEGDVVPVGSVLVVLDVEEGGEQARREDKRPAPSATAVGDLKESLPGMTRAEEKPRPIPSAGEAAPGAREPVAPPVRPAEPVRIQGDGAPARREERGPEYFSDKPLAAPATRKLARELGVDLQRVPPSGPGGRLTREDVERAARGGREGQRPSPPAPSAPEEKAPPVVREPAEAPRPAAPPPVRPQPAPEGAERRVPIRGLRKRIYENMARSKHTAAHFTYVDECEATALKQMRDRAKAHAAEQGVGLSFLPFIVKAVVAALRRHPELNCVVDDAAQEIVLRSTYDIGIAVATESGLTVPVLRGADRLNILEMAREIDRLAAEARAGKTRREDLGGSSFTITSLGKLGGLFATPIVNYPEVAILGVHELKRRPVVKDDAIVIADVMFLSLSFDHRIIDGHVGAAFAQEVIRYLEEPDRLMVEMR